MNKTKDTILGVIMTVSSSLANLAHSIFTVWLLIEQIETGWGYGTNIEMGALFPWLIEIASMPLLIFGIVYFIICRKTRRSLYVTNAALFATLILQYAATNLFIFN